MPEFSVYVLASADRSLAALMAADSGPVLVIRVESQDEQKRLYQISKRPIAQALWCAALALPLGADAEYINQAAAYKLLRWPNFGAIGHDPQDIAMAGWLAQRAMTTNELAVMAVVPISRAREFMMACYALKLLAIKEVVVAESPPIVPPQASSGRQAIFGGILRRVRERLGLAS